MTETSPLEGSEAPRRPGRKALRRLLVALAVFVALFYGGGGWYFSTQLGNDAFRVDTSGATSFTVEVAEIDDARVTLRAEEDEEPTLDTPGVFALQYDGGTLELGDVVSSTTSGGMDVVVRNYRALIGSAPPAGTLGDFDSWVYPDDPADLRLSYEDVEIATDLGPMDAWLVRGGSDRWVILIHGKGATKRETLRMMGVLAPTGVSLLSISYRNDAGQPTDPSGYYRYGATEWADLEDAVAFAVGQGAEDVVLVGLSTGAALSLGFMYESDLAGDVVAMIFDAPNIDFGRTVDFGASQRTLPVIGAQVPQSLTTVAKLIGSVRFGVDWSELDYIDRIEEIDVPVLVFHGTADTTVPVDVSDRLRDMRAELVELHIIEGAEHVQAWNVDRGQYETEVLDFIAGLSS